MKQYTCGFIGLGLIAGSIARALRKASDTKSNNCDITIIATDPDKASLELALSEGVADKITDGINNDFKNCDIIFLCAPVSDNSHNLLTLKEILESEDLAGSGRLSVTAGSREGSSSSCYPVITDVGSVKTPIHEAVRKAGLSHCFIGGHPMAGSERFGYRNSSELILQNAYYILTPEPETPLTALETYKYLAELMGAIPIVMEPSEHDRVTAAISHLPHLIASALVNLVRDSDGKNGLMKQMAAGGFKDITRIASSSPDMWEQICLNNGDNILSMMDGYIEALGNIREKIRLKSGGEIHSFFDGARAYRDSFVDTSYGPIKKAYDMFINITDEPGAIAQISTTLAVHQVNIKNLGIVHNRELAEGTLRIEFPSEDNLNTARKLLLAKGYEVVR